MCITDVLCVGENMGFIKGSYICHSAVVHVIQCIESVKLCVCVCVFVYVCVGVCVCVCVCV